jgi:hypothetical protein
MMSLPPRVKRLRGKRNEEWHLFCAGEGCGERLAIVKRYPLGPDPLALFFSLEPRYSNEPNPSYPEGTWWRRLTGAYKGIFSARHQRRVLAHSSISPDDPAHEFQMRPYIPPHRRGSMRPPLPTPEGSWSPGPQIEVCYECGGHAIVDTSAVPH